MKIFPARRSWVVVYRTPPRHFSAAAPGLQSQRTAEAIHPAACRIASSSRSIHGFMIGDMLRHFQLASVLKIRGDVGSAESMIADLG
jgi:hypothetical protein